MKKALSIAFAAILAALLLLTLALPDARFSALENRILQQRPTFSLSSALDGSWMDDMERWLSDQFPGRDFFVRARVTLDYLLGRREIGGTCLGSEGQYFEPAVSPDEEQVLKNAGYLRALAAQRDYCFLPVYSAASLYPDRLPAFFEPLDERALLRSLDLPQNVTTIDPYDALVAARGEEIYFRTDHHWTQQGAYIAYQAYCQALGLEPVRDLTLLDSPQPFYGSLYSQAPLFGAQPDALRYYDIPVSASVVYEMDPATRTDGLYALDALEKKDQYTLFLDGNHARVDIETDAGTGRSLIVIKDSFAHALVPLLAQHYDQIVMLDLRYYNAPIGALLDEYPDADLLVTYNLSWLAQDKNLFKLLR